MVTLASNDGREERHLDLELDDPAAQRLILADAEGSEYHFGCGAWNANGTFNHVATYTDERRRPYAWWSDVLGGFQRGVSVREAPELGPRVSPLVEVALTHLVDISSQHKGFHTDEKVWAVQYLRALWDEAEEPLDPAEIEVWAATHGWSIKHAKVLGEIAVGVRNGKRFRGVGGRAIASDRQRAEQMIAHWRDELARA